MLPINKVPYSNKDVLPFDIRDLFLSIRKTFRTNYNGARLTPDSYFKLLNATVDIDDRYAILSMYYE